MKNKQNKQEEKGIINHIKTFFQVKVVKMTLFFGFYFFFFLFLSFFLKDNNIQKPSENNNQNVVTDKEVNNQITDLFTINPIIDDNYSYNYIVLENDNEIKFEGTINEDNLQIKEYVNNYFFNIYNVRQLIKNSKYISKENIGENIIYYYELNNKTINELRNKNEIIDGVNNIIVKTNNNLVVTDIEMDLSNYMNNSDEFTKYKITLQYRKVANNEESNIN